MTECGWEATSSYFSLYRGPVLAELQSIIPRQAPVSPRALTWRVILPSCRNIGVIPCVACNIGIWQSVMTVSILRSILAHQTSEYEHPIPVSVPQYGPLASQNGLGSSDPANHQRQQCVRNGEIHTAEPDLNAPRS